MATHAQGSNGQVLIQTETTFKADPASPAMNMFYITGETFRLQRNIIESQVLSPGRQPRRGVFGNYEVSGSMNTELSPQMGLMLLHTLGTVTTTDLGGGKYSHVFKISQLPVGMRIEKGFTDMDAGTYKYFTYKGCRVNSASFSWGSEGFVDTTFELMGAVEDTATVTFDSSPTDNGHTPFGNFEAAVYEGVTQLGIVTTIDMTISNNLDGNMYVIGGQGQRRSIPAGTAAVNGNITVLFEDTTMYEKAKAGTETSIKVTVTTGTGDGSTNNEYIEFLIPEVRFAPSAPTLEGPQGITMQLPFNAYYQDSTEASALQITLRNTIASIA